MNFASILFKLSRRRGLVAGAALLGLLAGFLVAFRPSLPPQSRRYHVGTATVRILIDTPSSQLIAVDPSGLDTLAARADLIAGLMVDGTVKAGAAERVGVSPSKIEGISATAAGAAPSPAPKSRGYVLSTKVLTDVNGNQLPVVEISTQAPDAGRAAGLANAAVVSLQGYLDVQAAAEKVPQNQRIHVVDLGPAQASELTRGPGAMLAAALAGFVFLVACAAILLIPALVRDWREAVVAEQSSVSEPAGAGTVPDERLEGRRWQRATAKLRSGERKRSKGSQGSRAAKKALASDRG
ncbi:MAG: hypothetical protein JO243_08770 [Solirubrobacterales bacterium]|nr:hypothetical protein [Solirubrobacterales bacterium]